MANIVSDVIVIGTTLLASPFLIAVGTLSAAVVGTFRAVSEGKSARFIDGAFEGYVSFFNELKVAEYFRNNPNMDEIPYQINPITYRYPDYPKTSEKQKKNQENQYSYANNPNRFHNSEENVNKMSLADVYCDQLQRSNKL